MKFKNHKNGVLTYEVQNGTIKLCPSGTTGYKLKVFDKKGLLISISDKPAYIGADGSQEWCRDGLRHRDGDKPACIYANGSQYWYRDGKCHRDGDKPAVVHADGTQEWYRDDKRIK